MPIHVIARIKVLPQTQAELQSEMLKLVPETLREDGCLGYTLHQDNTDPTLFLFYETWADTQALDKHLSSPHLQAFLKLSQGKTAEFSVNKLTRLA